ncbi:taste receptor, type 2, member 202 [Lepisosteus oculatus]|uniref:Taste receptor type 2 n=1 Tax=Lepisosteus oculatus TaxID=7918 RepID=W5NN79_LEPOC|nr:PREDICTED: uncharacterized protein LOC102694852 [Lepisosteus oculatus]
MLLNEVIFTIWLLTGFVAVLTIFFNLYILLMNLKTYRKNGHWAPCEIIITALCLCSGAHQIICYLWMTMDNLDPDCFLGDLFYSLLMVTIYSLKFSIVWSTAFLSFFYSTKLVIEPIHCYTRIQDAFLKHTTTVVLIIPLCGFVSCVPMVSVISSANDTRVFKDCGALIPSDSPGKFYLGFYLLASDIIPGLLMIKSSISITVHLAIHLRHMKASTNGFHTPKLGSEMRVIRMTLALMGVFFCFVAVDICVQYYNAIYAENVMALTTLFSSIYTAASSFILVYGKKTHWKELLYIYSQVVDQYPCLTCLRVPENKHTAEDHQKH